MEEPASEEPESEEPASEEPASEEHELEEHGLEEHELEVRHHHAMSSAEARLVEVDLARRMHQHSVALYSLSWVVPRQDIAASLCASTRKAQLLMQMLAAYASFVGLP